MSEYRQPLAEGDEEEIDNIDHKVESDTSKPKYTTPSGRTVYGGGGITPDYIIKSGRITNYTAQLRGRAIILEYTNKYFERNGEDFRKSYEQDINKFLKEFEITEAMLDELVNIAKKKEIEFNEEQYNKDIRFIQTLLKTQIARTVWGNEGAYKVFHRDDEQFKKAISLFPEAEKIARLR